MSEEWGDGVGGGGCFEAGEGHGAAKRVMRGNVDAFEGIAVCADNFLQKFGVGVLKPFLRVVLRFEVGDEGAVVVADVFVEFVFDKAEYHDVFWRFFFFENVREVELSWAVNPAAERADGKKFHGGWWLLLFFIPCVCVSSAKVYKNRAGWWAV